MPEYRSPADVATDQVVFERRGHLGLVTLNRPRTVNALTSVMVASILEQLRAWAVDDDISTVLVRGAGERGLCAGGDIVAIYEDMLVGGKETADFWRTEYQLNSVIAGYPKPYVALMDGLVLGGGVGISAHGSIRVVTERTRMGMPETTIGFVPDVGGTFLLSRAPGGAGKHAALTGAHLAGPDAIYVGLADYYVSSDALNGLTLALESEPAEVALKRFSEAVPVSELREQRAWIDSCYAADTAENILFRLKAAGGEAEQAAKAIEAKSPTAVKVTLESLRRAHDLTLEQALEQEYRVGIRFLETADFREGIRAQVVDKDRNPQWKPTTLSDISAEDVARYFAPLGKRELTFAVRTTEND